MVGGPPRRAFPLHRTNSRSVDKRGHHCRQCPDTVCGDAHCPLARHILPSLCHLQECEPPLLLPRFGHRVWIGGTAPHHLSQLLASASCAGLPVWITVKDESG